MNPESLVGSVRFTPHPEPSRAEFSISEQQKNKYIHICQTLDGDWAVVRISMFILHIVGTARNLEESQKFPIMSCK